MKVSSTRMDTLSTAQPSLSLANRRTPHSKQANTHNDYIKTFAILCLNVLASSESSVGDIVPGSRGPQAPGRPHNYVCMSCSELSLPKESRSVRPINYRMGTRVALKHPGCHG